MAVDLLLFLSTLSLRRATGQNLINSIRRIISIHALLAESDVTVLGIQHRVGISIHALLAESDAALEDAESEPQNISIHALLAESDHRLFLSGRPVPFISIQALLAESDLASLQL